MEQELLNVREHQVLEAIIRNYVLSATPTSSRYLSKQEEFDLSAASIRNCMGDLEEQGFIMQPHTSAGRIPTDKGYRYYVDRIMQYIDLPDDTKEQIRSSIVTVDQSDLHLLMETASKALSRATHQLGVILAPKLRKGIFRHIHVFPMESTSRYVMNVTIDSGFVKTMIVEFETRVPHERLEVACRIITGKFAGKSLYDMCEQEMGHVQGVSDLELGVIRLLVPSIRKILESEESNTVYAEGETNVLLQPEFFDRERIGMIIEIFEEKSLLMHLFEATDPEERGVMISIGGENRDGQLQSFSVIKTTYHMGSMVGSLGVIGPRRMPYPFLVAAVDYTARLLGELHT